MGSERVGWVVKEWGGERVGWLKEGGDEVGW